MAQSESARTALVILATLTTAACAHLAPWPSASTLPRAVREDPGFPDTEIRVHRRRICGHPLTLDRTRLAQVQLMPREKSAIYRGHVVSCERGMLPWWRCSEPEQATFIHDPRNAAEIEVADDVDPGEAAAVIARTLDALERGTVFPPELGDRPSAPLTEIRRFDAVSAVYAAEGTADCAYAITMGSFRQPGHATLCVPSARARNEVRWIREAAICFAIACEFLD